MRTAPRGFVEEVRPTRPFAQEVIREPVRYAAPHAVLGTEVVREPYWPTNEWGWEEPTRVQDPWWGWNAPNWRNLQEEEDVNRTEDADLASLEPTSLEETPIVEAVTLEETPAEEPKKEATVEPIALPYEAPRDANGNRIVTKETILEAPVYYDVDPYFPYSAPYSVGEPLVIKGDVRFDSKAIKEPAFEKYAPRYIPRPTTKPAAKPAPKPAKPTPAAKNFVKYAENKADNVRVVTPTFDYTPTYDYPYASYPYNRYGWRNLGDGIKIAEDNVEVESPEEEAKIEEEEDEANKDAVKPKTKKIGDEDEDVDMDDEDKKEDKNEDSNGNGLPDWLDAVLAQGPGGMAGF